MALLLCPFRSRLSSALWHEEINSRGGKNEIAISPAMKINLGHQCLLTLLHFWVTASTVFGGIGVL